MTFDDVVNRAMSMFDTDQPTVVQITNERQARMVSEAEFRLVEQDLGPTVAGQSDYALGGTIENVAFVQLGTDTEPYIRASARQMVDLRTGRGSIDDPNTPGAFAIHADPSGTLQIRLWPTPTTGGQSVLAWTAQDPGDATYGSSAALVVPRRVHAELLDGVIAELYEQIENRWDLAAPHEQSYAAGIQKLIRFKNARLGAGATQIARGW